MKTQTSGYLVILGIFVIFLGLIGYLTHPEKAHTALMAGGSFGVLAILCGILGAKHVRWSKAAALLTAGLLGAACIWRASLNWLAVAGGESE
ncbi:MAG TPA: TMEM14 family protein, partial [Verrucomicrobiae bacterium]|nr:TMEM14 family protein [Verrucomicrobiae bacterium]